MKFTPIKTKRLILRGFTKDDALWAYHIWNDPEMGQYLPDEAKDSMQRVGTCSFMISEEETKNCDAIHRSKIYDIAYCVHKDFWRQGYATEIAQGMIDYARQGAEKVTISSNTADK